MLFSNLKLNVGAVRFLVDMLSSVDSDEFPALSLTFVFTLYGVLYVSPVNSFDVCHADHAPFLYIAYCFVDAFIPDKLSVCLNVAVMLLVVAVAIGATSVGAVLSIFTV